MQSAIICPKCGGTEFTHRDVRNRLNIPSLGNGVRAPIVYQCLCGQAFTSAAMVAAPKRPAA